MERFKIGELASAAGVSRDTVRYYERAGLLPSPDRSGAGYRLYSDSDLLRLKFVRSSQGLGFTLAEAGELLALQTSDIAGASAALQITRDKIRRAVTRVEELNQIRAILEELAAAYPTDAPTGDCPMLAFISAKPPTAAAKTRKAEGGTP
jgi:DNA-binding transcriptional MerR regulator